MISVILYGRNDNHGYNFHKRLAISINSIAEVLTDPEDEILFVDYNTINDLPTILEAIQDTLTEKAKKRIKILRIREECHAQFKDPKLPILEAVARNAAIRRSNPKNRWILSTNPDMIFIPKIENESLTSVVSRLEEGFYLLPRFSIPEHLWEHSLDRLNPVKNFSLLRSHSLKLHLHTTVRRPGFLQFDNPGDFQLALRKDLFAIGAFDEEMRNGWHVDSNLSKRMALLGKNGRSLEGELIAFHCNHNHYSSASHSKSLPNDWDRFVNRIISPFLNNPNWGLANQKVEEVAFNQIDLSSLVGLLGSFQEKTYDVMISSDTYNRPTYQLSRVFTYLADYLFHIPKDLDLGYLGYNQKLIQMLTEFLKERGHGGQVIDLLRQSDEKVVISKKIIFVADFGFNADSQGKKRLKKIVQNFIKICSLRKKNRLDGRFIGLNVLHTDAQVVFSTHLLTRSNGHSTGVIYGEIPKKGERRPTQILSWLHYCVVRYLFEYTDSIRRFAFRKIIKKSGPSTVR